MHSLLRSRQGELDRVYTQLHTGYAKSEHICARTQAIVLVLGHQVSSKMRLTTPCRCLTKTKKTGLLHPRCKKND